jgi:xylan 1,4-beta-xylosidase
MAPWIADTIRQCDGLVDMMSYWTFSDVFEEGGPVAKPFWGGFGLIADGAVPKPAFNAFALLHRLGERRLAVEADDVLATKRGDGSLAVAAWNLAPPEQTGRPRALVLRFAHAARRQVKVTLIDATRGSPLPAYEAMGRPPYPTQAQLRALRAAAALPAPRARRLSAAGELPLTLPPQSLALIELR